MNVDIWSDIACPWCFIGKRRFEKALAEFPHKDQVTVTWHSFQLDPSLPEHYDGTELEYLSQRKGLQPARVEQMFGHVAQVAAREGLAYDFGKVVVANSFAGHELIHLAKAVDAAGAGTGAGPKNTADGVKEALLSAHFEKGQDIGSREVLVEVGVAAGLAEADITEALDAGTYRDAVHADIREAQSLGIQGVPFFVLDNKYGVSGAQPTELFAQALDTAWRESNPLVMVGSEELNGEACGPEGC
ncbi:DsbA family oxidoreductase [Sinomonas sp. P47F7]|uniref:DsbA family oxidoreductase n=1 Tax=Sinomonas sp. P47F7 TaxID=3410987 RepID=UPI003BF4BF68